MSAPDTPPPPSSAPARGTTTWIVEHEVRFTLPDLARASRADVAWLRALVDEGALRPEPEPDASGQWLFHGEALRRARLAQRLGRDFDLGAPEAALVLDLLDEIEALRRRLSSAGL